MRLTTAYLHFLSRKEDQAPSRGDDGGPFDGDRARDKEIFHELAVLNNARDNISSFNRDSNNISA